jgi:hypothetical protein
LRWKKEEKKEVEKSCIIIPGPLWKILLCHEVIYYSQYVEDRARHSPQEVLPPYNV